MPHDEATRLDAIRDLHREWGELVALRRSVRAAPYDEAAERHLVERLRRHRTKLGELRAAILEDVVGDSRTPVRSAMRSGAPH